MTCWKPDALPDGGHAELVYDFREGGEANGWMHALFRFEDRHSGHAAESSFGAHIFNTIMTYKNEPQSYSGKPPGLSTRLFLKLGFGGRESFCVLIYPASGPWLPQSDTALELYDANGALIDTAKLSDRLFRFGDRFPVPLFHGGKTAGGGRDRLCADPRHHLPAVRVPRRR